MSEAFRALHRPGEPLLLPNAWDYASAAALARAGFAAIGTTSLGVAVAAGLPDGEGVTRDQTVALTRVIGRLPILLTVDVEGGFSDDTEQVADLVAVLAELGAVGVNLEDGRADGSLADGAADLVTAIKRRCPEVFVNARTDAYWLRVDRPLEQSVRRGLRYVEAGADGLFVPGVADAGAIATLVREVPLPLNVLFGPGGFDRAQLADLGVARISTGSLLFRTALHAAVEMVARIGAGGPPEAGVPGYHEVAGLVRG